MTLLIIKSKSPSLSKSPYADPLEYVGMSKPNSFVEFSKDKFPIFLKAKFESGSVGIISINFVIGSSSDFIILETIEGLAKKFT